METPTEMIIERRRPRPARTERATGRHCPSPCSCAKVARRRPPPTAMTPGFVLAEALDLLAMCAHVEDEVMSPVPPTVPGWTLVFDSPVIGPFDEKWQLRRNTAGAWAVVIRG